MEEIYQILILEFKKYLKILVCPEYSMAISKNSLQDLQATFLLPFPSEIRNSGAARNVAMGAVLLPPELYTHLAQRPREDNTAIHIHLSNPNAFMFCI